MPARGFQPALSGGAAAMPIVTMPTISAPAVNVGGSLARSSIVSGVAEGMSIGKTIGDLLKELSPEAERERELRERELALREKQIDVSAEALGTKEERAEERKMKREAGARAARAGEREERMGALAEKDIIIKREREDAAIAAGTHVRTADGRIITKAQDDLEKLQAEMAIEAAKAARGSLPAQQRLADLQRRAEEAKAAITAEQYEKLTLGGDVPEPGMRAVTGPMPPALTGVSREAAKLRETLAAAPAPLAGPDIGPGSFAEKALANLPDAVKTADIDGAISAAAEPQKPAGRQPVTAGAPPIDEAEEQRRKIAGLPPTPQAEARKKAYEDTAKILADKYAMTMPATLEEGQEILRTMREEEKQAKKDAAKDKPAISAFKINAELLSEKLGEMDTMLKTTGTGLFTFDRAKIQQLRKLQSEIGTYSQNVGRAVMGSTRPGAGGAEAAQREMPLSIAREGEWLPNITTPGAAEAALKNLKEDLAQQIVAFGKVHGEFPENIQPEIAKLAVEYADRTKRPVDYQLMRPVIVELTDKLAASPDKRIQEVVKWLDENKDATDPTLRNQMTMVARKLMNDTAAATTKPTPKSEAKNEPGVSGGAH